MEIFITIASIFAISGLAWLANKILPFKICPICAGVAGTWIWMLVATLTGQFPISNFQFPMAILMGGSVVGIAYQLEKRLPAQRSAIAWKMIFIPIGFAAVYALLNEWWGALAVALVFLCITAWFFLLAARPGKAEDKKISELEKEMKKCC